MKKVTYDSKPTVIEVVGNGSYLYRCNIEENPKQIATDCEACINAKIG